MTKVELHRLAGAIATLRPDWAPQSLQTFLERHFAHRPYRDIAIALVTVAVDPTTATPARILEPGPWWQAASTRDVPITRNTCPDHPLAAIRTDPRTGEQTCGGCHADRIAAVQALPLRQRGVPPTPEVRAQLVAAITRSNHTAASDATPAGAAEPDHPPS
jgi:hypothetical protein